MEQITMEHTQNLETKITVQRIISFTAGDLHDLCDATESAIEEGGGFGWVKIPSRQVLESYFEGLLLVPDRELFVGRVDQVIAASAQLHYRPKNNEAQKFIGQIMSAFVAPWARGLGLGTKLIQTVEGFARAKGLGLLQMDLRETQQEAIHIYEKLGYENWAENPYYAIVNGKFVKGYYYQKTLQENLEQILDPSE